MRRRALSGGGWFRVSALGCGGRGGSRSGFPSWEWGRGTLPPVSLPSPLSPPVPAQSLWGSLCGGCPVGSPTLQTRLSLLPTPLSQESALRLMCLPLS